MILLSLRAPAVAYTAPFAVPIPTHRRACETRPSPPLLQLSSRFSHRLPCPGFRRISISVTAAVSPAQSRRRHSTAAAKRVASRNTPALTHLRAHHRRHCLCLRLGRPSAAVPHRTASQRSAARASEQHHAARSLLEPRLARPSCSAALALLQRPLHYTALTGRLPTISRMP